MITITVDPDEVNYISDLLIAENPELGKDLDLANEFARQICALGDTERYDDMLARVRAARHYRKETA